MADVTEPEKLWISTGDGKPVDITASVYPVNPGHPCPGCQRPNISYRMLACRPCWNRLPYQLQQNITTVGRHSRAHRDAVTAAAAWYRENPATPTEGAKQ